MTTTDTMASGSEENLPGHSLPPGDASSATTTVVATDETNLDADDHPGDEDVQHLEEHAHEAVYATMARADLLVHLEALVADTDLDATRVGVKKIFELYDLRVQEEKDTKLNQFIVSGGVKEDFKNRLDATDERFEDLRRRYNKMRAEHRRKKEAQLDDNLKAKRAIIEELKNMEVDSNNLKAAFDKLQETQTRWRTIGFVQKAYNEDLWQNYRYHIDRFYDLLKINKELRELDMKKNLEFKVELCSRAEDLLLESNINKATNAIRQLQDQWKSSGPVMKEHSEIVWDRFKSASDKIFDRRKEHIHALDGQQQLNLASKLALCVRLDELVARTPKTNKKWQETFEQIEGLMTEWKKTGYAPKSENENIWKRFRETRKVFFDARDAFFEVQRKEQGHNLNLKTDLVKQAEALQESSDWKQATETLKKLQAQWKEVGPTSYKQGEKLWTRFRAACDKFFAQKKSHFAGMESKMLDNLALKKDLLKTMQDFKLSSNHANDMAAIKKFQAEWLEYEPITIRDREAISNQYHKVLDKLFNDIRAARPDVDDQVLRMKVEHSSKSPQGQDDLRAEKTKIQDKIARLLKEVTLLENNIEFFSKSKNADKLKAEFMVRINASHVEIKDLKKQLNLLNPPPPAAVPVAVAE